MKKGLILFVLIVFILVFLIVLVPMIKAQVMINEVLYNPSPEQGGNNGELIELYNENNFDINLSNWTLKDKGSSITFLEGIIPAFGYAVIADDLTTFNQTWNISCLLIDGSLWLNNLGDEIWLWNETGGIEDYVDYEDIAEQGESIQLINLTWKACFPTPGQENNCTVQEPEQECYENEDCDENEICSDGECIPEEINKESELEITDFPEEAVFGDIVDVKLNIYRGDTGKYAVYVRIENEKEIDVSEETVLHVLTKYVDYKIKVPVQLKLNCNVLLKKS